MKHRLFPQTLLSLLMICIAAQVALGVDDPINTCISEPGSLRGVVVVAADTPVGSLIDLAQAAPVVVLAVTADANRADTLRSELRAANVYGQVVVQSVRRHGRITLADDTATLVIADLPSVDEEELLRITRPLGKLHQRKDGPWQVTVKPRPDGTDDWTHYNGDPANSQHSEDTVVGPPRGMQWLAGPTNNLSYLIIEKNVMIGQTRPIEAGTDRQSLIARDAHSGLPLWTRDDIANNRFSLVLDDGKLYYHPRTGKYLVGAHTLVLDALTGETLQTLDQGLDFTVTKEQARQDRRAYQKQQARAADMQFRLADGILLQVIREQVVALDAKTGKRLWQRDAGSTENGFASPTVGDGKLFLVLGPYVRYSSYTHWPMSQPAVILALDLQTGEELWQLKWDAERFFPPHAVYSLQYSEGLLAAAVTGYDPNAERDFNRPRAYGLLLDASDGDVQYFGREQGAWPGTTGHGHSHVRMHLRDKTAWTLEIGGPKAYWPIGNAAQFVDFNKVWKDKGVGMRPVSCTVWRSNPKYWIGGLGLYPMSGEGDAYFNRSGRSNCDIGAFPANGLLYSPPNTCQCQPYLPGTKAYHSREFAGAIPENERLLRGKVQPAPNAKNADEQWPQWAQGPARRWWSHQTVSTKLQPIWQTKVAVSQPPELLAAQWQADAILRGPITQASVAEGVLVFAESHAQRIIALDPLSGERLWSHDVNGRVDMAPSIHKGIVFVGTRNGYVYALNRDDGQLIWRFTAAPREERIVVNGQLESPWPVFGAVAIDGSGAFVVAGRHNSNDGGLWWWQLEPAKGSVVNRGRFDDGEASGRAANWIDKLPLEQRPIQNSVAVLGDRTFQLVGQPVKRTEYGLGSPLADGRASQESFITWEMFDARQFDEKVVRSGRNAFIGERQQTVGGWRKPRYANTLARLFAIDLRRDRFVSVGGGRGTAHGRGGGGDSKVHLMRRLESPEREGPHVHLAEVVWTHDDPLLRSRGNPSISAIAVSDNAVFLGLSILGPESDRIYRQGRAEMPHRLRILDLNTGEVVRDMPLPGQPLQGGVALADGRVYVATEDGSVTAFAAE